MDGQRPRRGSPESGTSPATDSVTDPLTVSHGVVVEMVRTAVLEVPGVLNVRRGGPLAWLAGSPVKAQVVEGKASVRIWIIARPGQALAPLAAQVRQVVGATLQRLLSLEATDVTVVIDGVGRPSS